MNQNKLWRQSADNRSVDLDALSVVPTHTDEANDDVINIPHSSKKGQTSNKIQCTSNDPPSNTDINNSTKDSYKKSVFEPLSIKSSKSQNYGLGNITVDQSNISISFQDNYISHHNSCPNIELEISKNYKSISDIANLDPKERESFTAKNERNESGKRRHRSRSHSTDSKKRKKIDSSTNGVCRKFENDWANKVTYQNNECQDEAYCYSVGRRKKSFLANYSSSFVKDMESSRCTANRERSPLKRTIHHSPWKNKDIHISSHMHYDNRSKPNATVDRIYRSNVHTYNANDRNRTHAIDSKHEHQRHELSSRVAKNASSTTFKNDETNGNTLNLNQRKDHKGRQESRSDIRIVPCTKQYNCYMYNKNIPEKYPNVFYESNHTIEVEKISETDTDKTICDDNKVNKLTIFPDLCQIESYQSSVIDNEFGTEESYLKRLFMVHRQDFIRPLCNGLISLRNSLRVDHYCLEKKWLHDDIHVYTNICFLTQCCNEHNGITWKIRFDISQYSRCRKLLKSGSLVCLTNKKFTFLQYATVAENNDRNGISEIRFIEDIPKTSEMFKQRGVILIESQVFFPSYFHTLLSIKCMHNMKINEEDSLPFGTQLSNKKHSLNQEEPDYFKSPSLLKEGFDFSCFSSGQPVNTIDISNEANWPDSQTLGMDDSQHRALITSMKRKFALIQGPPGTGKTVVGLKIAELLLHNEHVWRKQDNQGPMLLLSYTNHALDQFLVEVSKRFGENDDTDIVRLGSKSKIDILKKYNLTDKRKAYTFKTERGKFRTRKIRESTGEHNELALSAKIELKIIIKQHENLQKVWREIQTGIVHQDWLRNTANVITEPQYMALKNNDSLIIWLQSESITRQVMTIQNNFCEAMKDDFGLELNDKKYRYANRSRIYDEEDIQTSENFPNMHLDIESLKIVFSEGVLFTNEKIKDKLDYTEVITTEEANSVSDIWCINKAKRWQLYKYWVQQSLIPLNEKIQNCEDRYKAAQQLYAEEQQKADIIILKKARLIACTTTRAARDKEILKHVSPSIFLIEEAAEIPEHHVVACLTSSCQQLIMIGDHQQLRPSYYDYKTAQQHKIDISLFERLIDEGFPFTQLEYQHRMRPTISKLLVPHIYKTLKNDANVFEYENVKGMHCDMFLISHSVFEDQDHNKISKSQKNKFEALFICELYRYLRFQGYKSSEITVLSTYLDQVRLLIDSIGKVDEELTRKNEWFSSQQSVRVDTVDNFQGEENEIVLLSLVRSNREQNIGYLYSDNRVCVALSRAKKGFYAIGNFELLKTKSKLWNKIVSDVKKTKHIGNRLQLTCQTHRTSTYVSKPEDFKRVVDGGCYKPCSLKRPCGHICLRKCHADDPDHEGHCPKQCKKVCEMGHQCTKPCHFPNSCEKCNDIVEKTIPKCQHVKRLPCHKDPQLESCGTRCQVIISCGHQCKNICGDPCSTEDTCKQFKQVKARCGHGVLVVCSTKYDASCKLSCPGVLSCGHKCKGTHSDCSQGRLHIPCEEKCQELTIINKTNTDAFRNTPHIKGSTNISGKWFIIRNLITEHESELPCKIFQKLWSSFENASNIDTFNMIFEQISFLKIIIQQRKKMSTFINHPQLKAWLDRLRTWVFLERNRYTSQDHTEFNLEIRRLQLITDIQTFKEELSRQGDTGLPMKVENYLQKLESIKVVEEDELSTMRKEFDETSTKMNEEKHEEKQRTDVS